jgi:hypothetical protein
VPDHIRPTDSVQQPCRPAVHGSPRPEVWPAWLSPWPGRRPSGSHRAQDPRNGAAIAGGPATKARRGGWHKHPRTLRSTPRYARGGRTHHAGLMTVGGGKGLRARVPNSGEGVPVDGDNSKELLRVGKREGSVMAHSAAFESGPRKWGKQSPGAAHAKGRRERGEVKRARCVEGGSGRPVWRGRYRGGRRLGDALAGEERVEGPRARGPLWPRWHGSA